MFKVPTYVKLKINVFVYGFAMCDLGDILK